jgi:hypothetical protein
MSNLCNQISTLSNTAEIAESDNRFKLSPLLLNEFKRGGLIKLSKNIY